MHWRLVVGFISAAGMALAAGGRYILGNGGPYSVKLPKHLVNHAVDSNNSKNAC